MCIFSMCQVVEGPFLKSGFSSLLRRVDINIKIGSKNYSNILYDFLIKYLHFLKSKSTKRQGCVPSAKIQFWKTTFKEINVPKGHFHKKMPRNDDFIWEKINKYDFVSSLYPISSQNPYRIRFELEPWTSPSGSNLRPLCICSNIGDRF